MHWDLLSRLRRPGRPQSTPQPPQETVPQEPSPPQLPINRKILQNPSSFLEAESQPALPLGLTPSTRLPSADGGSDARSRSRPPRLALKPALPRSELSPDSSVDISPRTQSRSTISRISKIATGGEWSTFGRKRDHAHAPSQSPSPTKDSKHPNASSTPSLFTPSRIANLSIPHGGPSTRSPQSPGSNISSPADTISSKLHPQTPQGPSSYTTPIATSSGMISATPVNRERDVDSPHTFGRPTPPDKSVEFSVSPVPPLPPLDHPELAAALSSRRLGRDRSNTLPTRRVSPRKDDLFTSLSLRLERSVRHRSSFTQASQAMAVPTETRPPDRHRRRRARTISAGPRRRRTSADWSSYQASTGVNSPANQAWPAEVSREILRLSLRDTPRAGPEIVPGSPGQRKEATRGSTTDPVRRSNRGLVLPSFLPFPHPSRPDSPPPSTASATLADGRKPVPYRPHSLQSDKRSQQTRKTAMVKRSLSVIESRNGWSNEACGVSYPSLGSADPAQPKAPQASPLLDPSLALTPSRSLLSGRVSPTDTPMASSVQGEPSTPTPAPRHLSEKSRGKRKAEENIDVTPPEQKKEGQRATFLLPSETRSQRISGSSHAPSSYHRKRARISSSSPFTTPAQSRPSSVHETPSRTHYFASLSSSTGARMIPSRTPSRAASTRSRQPPTPSTKSKHERRQSMSQLSIPISAIVSPHAPSVSRSTKFHMRDPRKPPKKPQDTPWGLRLATEDEPGSPIQAWSFFFGFLFFPLWWIAGLLLSVPKTRIAGDVDAEKGVAIDDPQIEYDARTWRFRCRIMAGISLFTYVPFIVLVAVFVPR